MGILDVERMLERMSSSQLSEWAAYFGLSAPVKASPVNVGRGQLGLEDWQRMDNQEKKQKSKDLYDLVRTWAVLSG